MMVRTQRKNKALKEALARVPGISFREILPDAGDSATFLSWFMPTRGRPTAWPGFCPKTARPRFPGARTPGTTIAHWEHLHNGSTVIAITAGPLNGLTAM
jgi:8-amino-3,8-dideoxy-alpha-D-manno-octulosonate transaminase